MSPTEKNRIFTLTLTGLLLVLLTCLIWGGSIPLIRLSQGAVPPLLRATARLAMASALLWVYTRFTGEAVLLPRPYFWHGVALGFLFGFTMLFLYLGLVLTCASRGTIFYSTKPFWVAVGAHFFVAEDRLTIPKLAGLGLALVGVYLTFGTTCLGTPATERQGDFMEIMAAVLFSATALYTKWLSEREKFNHFQTLFPMMVFSLPVLIALTLVFEWDQPVRFSWGGLLSLGYQGVGVQFLAYILWFWLIHSFPVSQVASFTFLVPLVGVIVSAILLGEPTPATLWFGLFLVATGIVLVNWPKRAVQPKEITQPEGKQ